MSICKMSLMTLTLAMMVGASTLTAKAAETNPHDGQFVSVSGNKLVMSIKVGGKTHSHNLAADVNVTSDGIACKAETLKAGQRIRVTTATTKGGKELVTRIEALDKNENFANSLTPATPVPADSKGALTSTHDGTFVSITGNKLVMANREGQQHSHLVSADAKVTCDRLTCKVSDLKAGLKIRVTTLKDNKSVATGIEAIDKDAAFAPTPLNSLGVK